jgi:hypothetical protein
MTFDWKMQYTIEKIFLRAIRYCPWMFQTCIFLGKYERPEFQDSKIPNFGTPNKNCHMDVAPMESHRVYCKEGSGVSSQKLQIV